MRILLVEDNKDTAAYIANGFDESGFNVSRVYDGREAMEIMLTREFECIILDIMLPGIDGITLLLAFRKVNKNTPVIMLTAKDSINDKVLGLSSGADDYLVKPFSFSELIERVKAVTRRTSKQDSVTKVVIDNLTVDTINHTAIRGYKNIELTKKEFNLLWLFMTHPNEVLSRTFISESLWDINFDTGTNVIDVSIKRLRAKIDDGFSKKLIHTIRGVGYVLRKD